jgi:hypothetical protein
MNEVCCLVFVCGRRQDDGDHGNSLSVLYRVKESGLCFLTLCSWIAFLQR